MNIALAQLAIEAGKVERNVERALDAIATAAANDADLVVLPEIFTVGYFAFDRYERYAESVTGPILRQISEAGADHGVAVLAGSIVEDLAKTAAETDVEVPADEGLANTSVFFDRDGKRQAVYRKHHLFGYDSAETELLVPGESLALAEFDGFTLAPTTCYDLRFPELYRDLSEAGATLILVPSAWPYPRVEHWQLLPRVRAIENQLYVATTNGAGEFEEATLVGRSTVFDPWGTILASSDDDPTIVTATIDPEKVATIRDEFPAWRDRRR